MRDWMQLLENQILEEEAAREGPHLGPVCAPALAGAQALGEDVAMTAADYLFEPCARYHLDPHRGLVRRMRELFRGKPAPSCVNCREQYLPGRVCETFRARLLVLGGWEATGGR